MAEADDATAIAFVIKLKRGGHVAGMEGDYRDDPDQALPAAIRLKEAILANQAMERQELGT